MPRWRYGLICAYVGLGLVGTWLVVYRHSITGWAVFGVGLICIGLHMALAWKEKREEETAQSAWVVEIKTIADSLSLEGYGIPTLEELARYHDLRGRAEILTALKALPSGQRSLFAAAMKVEADAAWD
jgi:hypothetical protein